MKGLICLSPGPPLVHFFMSAFMDVCVFKLLFKMVANVDLSMDGQGNRWTEN